MKLQFVLLMSLSEAGRGKTRSINVDEEHNFQLFPTKSGKIHRLQNNAVPMPKLDMSKIKKSNSGKDKHVKSKSKKFISAMPTTAKKSTKKVAKQAKLQEPKKVKKSFAVRAPEQVQAPSQSIQFSQWNQQRFGSAKPRKRL